MTAKKKKESDFTLKKSTYATKMRLNYINLSVSSLRYACAILVRKFCVGKGQKSFPFIFNTREYVRYKNLFFASGSQYDINQWFVLFAALQYCLRGPKTLIMRTKEKKRELQIAPSFLQNIYSLSNICCIFSIEMNLLNALEIP